MIRLAWGRTVSAANNTFVVLLSSRAVLGADTQHQHHHHQHQHQHHLHLLHHHPPRSDDRSPFPRPGSSPPSASVMEWRLEPSGPPFRNTPNRLADERSPYLLQHAHNPVDW
ncbi:hypothetical protein CRUP_008091 [Coryphaenoides rupestris]|nr:hypothetical protein CRUP_008091 [Coryphaenoides rupestris]